MGVRKMAAKAAVFTLKSVGYAMLWVAVVLGILFFAYETSEFIYMKF